VLQRKDESLPVFFLGLREMIFVVSGQGMIASCGGVW